jgi:ribosomal protein S18 acetylase RimI-like enzyme
METIIRDAQINDALLIVRLIHELVELDGDQSSLTADYVNDYLSQRGPQVLIADQAGEGIGLLSYWTRPNLFHAGEICLIEELIVSRQARGSGAGSALLQEVIRRAHERGCAEIEVTTMPDNTRAIDFYRRHGLADEVLMLEKHFH